METNLTLKEKIEKLQRIQNRLDKEYEKAIKKYRKMKAEVSDGFVEIFDFKDKFIKKLDLFDDGDYTYMYCTDVWKSKDFNGNVVLRLRGNGFFWNISPYSDSTYNRWAEWFDIEIKLDQSFSDLEKELKRITVITADEFDAAFNKMISEMSKRHKKNMKEYKEQIN